MRDIESENPHLKNSVVSDTLVWKDCVEYKFKSGGLSRPKVLAVPWPDLVALVKEAGAGLGEVASSSNRMGMSDGEIRRKISECLETLEGCPMSVPLMKATDIGKKVSKLLKACQKYDSDALEAFQDQLHSLLESWKKLASDSGVQVESSHSSSADCTGRDNKTSMQRYRKDVELLQNCHSWRDLYSTLSERQNKLMLQHGQKMRSIRNNLNTTKHKVKTAKVASIAAIPGSLQPRGTLKRLDEKLSNSKSKSIFISQQKVARTGTGISKSKMALLKKETARQTTYTKATMNQLNGKRSKSVFSVSVSNMNGEKKRDLPTMQKESHVVVTGAGKKMKMPSSKTANMLHKERVNGVRR